MEEKARHIVSVLQDVKWKEISKDAMLKLVEQLELDNIAGENKENLKIRLKKYLDTAQFAMENMSPRPSLGNVEGHLRQLLWSCSISTAVSKCLRNLRTYRSFFMHKTRCIQRLLLGGVDSLSEK
jgi:hypothetical protein